MLKSPGPNHRDSGRRFLLNLAISPCPNDTFAFYALLAGKTQFPQELSAQFADIEELNQLCLSANPPDLCKISFHAYLYLKDRFQLLDSGSALGFGCGPLLVAAKTMDDDAIRQATIAVPGTLTTATLLLKLRYGQALDLKVMRFDDIMPAVAAGQVDAGLIIHESRFTYPDYGLLALLDLGDWWEQETGCAIPLGGIVVNKSLPETTQTRLDLALKQSIDYAWAHQAEVVPFMQQHAQEMKPEVMQRHVDLYVNERTRSLGPSGHRALEVLWQKAVATGLIRAE